MVIESAARRKIPNISVLACDVSTNQLQPVRPKVKHACKSCKERKIRCDGKLPCKSCELSNTPCVYVVSEKRKKRKVSSVVPRERTLDQKEVQQRRKTESNVLREDLLSLFSENEVNKDTDDAVLIKLLKDKINKANSLPIPAVKEKINIILPPKEIALDLIEKTWNSACLLFRFYHRPTFLDVVTSLYEVKDDNFSERQLRFLPLIYAVIAVGALFSKSYEPDAERLKQSPEFFQDEGQKFFEEAKNLIDPINTQDIESLQALFQMTIFLQCNANLSRGYSYIGLALRSAVRQNFHRKSSLQVLDPLQAEVVKRLFWSIYKTDIYMNCILGLPNSLDESLVDQEFPLNVDDRSISASGLMPSTGNGLSSCGINNEHTKLILIMNHTHKVLYPMSLSVTSISHSDINSLELELNVWFNDLPAPLKSDYVPPSPNYVYYLKPNRYLHLDYLHVRIMLSRPFIHYLVLDEGKFPSFQFQIMMANRCISVARNVVQLAVEMHEQKMLNGVYWFSVHTIFFSVACLMYFIHQSKLKDPNIRNYEVEKDCKDGLNLLSALKDVSIASNKTFEVLNLLFEKLNEKTLHLSDNVLNAIIQKEEQREIDQFTKFTDLFMENNLEETLLDDYVGSPTEVYADDFINKLLSKFIDETG